MFRLHKLKSQKYGERLEFNFFNFHALQVPRGWDKLYVSIVSAETGKTLGKSGKSLVRNGSCQWTDTLSESILVSQQNGSKQIEACPLKLVVSMGSARSNILGEVTINLASYRNSTTSVAVSLPLKKCNHGTILQLKIQCPTSKEKLREEKQEETASYMDDVNVDYDDMESKSDVSDSSLAKSVGSSSSNNLDTSSHAGELLSRDFSLSASSSRHSFDSMDGSLGREAYSPRDYLKSSSNNQIGRQDSTGSQSVSHGSYSFNDSSRSNHSSLNSKVSASRRSLQIQRDKFTHVSQSVASSPLRNAGLSTDLLEVAESKIEELRAEARMWEQNARKLMNDVERLRKELLDQSKHQASLEMELSESQRECGDLKQEVEQVKILLEQSMTAQKSAENMEFQAKEMDNLQRQLEDEVRFEKESNANLALQLKKTQESNIELVSVLQELEETIEKQKMEISSLSTMQSKDKNVGKCCHGCEDKPNEEVLPNNVSQVPRVSDLECDANMGESSASFEPKDNVNTDLDIQKVQGSQKNLCHGQMLEKFLHEKIHELEAALALKNQTLVDSEVRWKDELATKEEEIINLQAKLSEVPKIDDFGNGSNNNLIKEVEVLKQKIEELEKDCSELTDENLELVLRLKHLERDVPRRGSDCLLNEHTENDTHSISEYEVSKMKHQICKLEEELNTKEMLIEQLSTDHLQVQCTDPEKKCTELELQLQASKEKTSYLDGEICKYHARADDQRTEITMLRSQLESCQVKETEKKDQLTDKIADIDQSSDAVAMSKTLSDLHEQVQLCLANLKKQQFDLDILASTECQHSFSNTEISNAMDFGGQKEKVVAILKNFIQLKILFEAKVATCNGELKGNEEKLATAEYIDEVQNKFECCNLKDNIFSTSGLAHQFLQMKVKPEITDSGKEILERESDIEKLKSDNLLKEKGVEALGCCELELGTQISDLQNEKRQLEENSLKDGVISCLDGSQHEIMVLNGSTMTSSCLDASEKETTVLNNRLDSHVLLDEVPVKKSDLESSKSEIEFHLSELEKENVQLSERICGLEAQLRYLTDEKESSRLELQNSESCAINLQEQIRKLEGELETEKSNRKLKLQEMQDRWLEAQREGEYLKISNMKLQTTAESLVDECSLLQKSIIELRKQKMELHEKCRILEAELRESQKSLDGMLKEVEALDEKYILMLEEITSKEKALGLELDMLLQDNKQYKETLIRGENLLNQMYLKKVVEVENLQKGVSDLTEHMSGTSDEKERTVLEAVLEVSQLRADKAMVEASLENIREKFKLSDSNFSALQLESETKLLALQKEFAASKQSQEILLADNEKLLELLEDVKSNEEKHKSIVRGLNLKIKASASERLQLEEEISNLKIQLQRTALLENEILALKKSLNEVQFENQRLEVSLQMLSGDYEELKAEKMNLLQMNSDMKRAVFELEHCKHNKISLEEKVLRLEGDLTAREAFGAHEAELKNELARVKRANSELHRKMKLLQEDRQESIQRAQASEGQLKTEAKQGSEKYSATSENLHTKSNAIGSSTSEDLKLSQVDGKYIGASGCSQVTGTDSASKMLLLETKLAEALEANDMYKSQLKSMLLEGCKDYLHAVKNLANESEQVNKSESSLSALENELRELRDRYFHMSLKCAEVENEREGLMLKLRTVSNGRC